MDSTAFKTWLNADEFADELSPSDRQRNEGEGGAGRAGQQSRQSRRRSRGSPRTRKPVSRFRGGIAAAAAAAAAVLLIAFLLVSNR